MTAGSAIPGAHHNELHETDSVTDTMLIACLLGVQHHMLEILQIWNHTDTLHHALVIKLSMSSILFEIGWNCLWREVIVPQLLSADKRH